MIRFACTACQTAFTVDDKNAGKSTTCTKCGQKLKIPGGAAEPRPRNVFEEDDRPSRRRRPADDYEDDDRPSRRRRPDTEQDDYDDAPRSSRRTMRAAAPGRGLAITSLVLGIIGIVIGFTSGGPVLCGMCCIFLAPFSWMVSALAGILGIGGVLFGVIARSSGSTSPMAVWGIVLGGITVLLAIGGVILTLAFPAAQLALPAPGPGPQININPRIDPGPERTPDNPHDIGEWTNLADEYREDRRLSDRKYLNQYVRITFTVTEVKRAATGQYTFRGEGSQLSVGTQIPAGAAFRDVRAGHRLTVVARVIAVTPPLGKPPRFEFTMNDARYESHAAK